MFWRKILALLHVVVVELERLLLAVRLGPDDQDVLAVGEFKQPASQANQLQHVGSSADQDRPLLRHLANDRDVAAVDLAHADHDVRGLNELARRLGHLQLELFRVKTRPRARR